MPPPRAMPIYLRARPRVRARWHGGGGLSTVGAGPPVVESGKALRLFGHRHGGRASFSILSRPILSRPEDLASAGGRGPAARVCEASSEGRCSKPFILEEPPALDRPSGRRPSGR